MQMGYNLRYFNSRDTYSINSLQTFCKKLKFFSNTPCIFYQIGVYFFPLKAKVKFRITLSIKGWDTDHPLVQKELDEIESF